MTRSATQGLAEQMEKELAVAALSDDDPLWERSSGGTAHHGIEWGNGDDVQAEAFYSALPGSARLILDLLMERPGERVDADWISAQLATISSASSQESARRSVAASLTAVSGPHRASGRRLPFYWWAGTGGAPSLYAMKPGVARLFRVARQRASAPELSAPAGTDWTDAEVRATVGDYLSMLADEITGRVYSKAQHRRALSSRLSPSRTEAAIEFKHQNISAAMVELGLPYIRGYKPRGNYQAALVAEIQRRLEAEPGLFGSLRLDDTPAAIGAPLERELPPRRQPEAHRGTHVDYGLMQEENSRVGRFGEQLVVDYERRQLLDSDRGDLAERVRWVAQADGDGLGYDVLSFDPDGNERHIEVKTTSRDADTPIYISSAELDFARRHPETYVLYRVYDVGHAPRFFALDSAQVIGLDMVPVTYRAWPVPPPEACDLSAS